jgi:hypothetical protein
MEANIYLVKTYHKNMLEKIANQGAIFTTTGLVNA